MMQVRWRCYYMTLMEVLVGLVLFTIMISSLLGAYVYFHRMHVNHVNLHHEKLERRYMKDRLRRIFSSITGDMQGQDKAQFFSEEYHGCPSLVFTYDNAVNRDPDASNQVLARLCIHRRDLCLIVWRYRENTENDEVLRYEKLMESVKEFQIDFDDQETSQGTELWNKDSRSGLFRLRMQKENGKLEVLLLEVPPVIRD